LRVLAEDPEAELHWTVILDRALRAGYLDPFANPQAREDVVRVLAAAAKDGSVHKTATGTYRHAPQG
jgi:hypothetical protein